MALEDEIAVVLLRARLLEKAIHGTDTWELQYCDQRQWTIPQIGSQGVTFCAEFETVSGETLVTLLCNGNSVLCTTIDSAPGERMQFSWTLSLGVLCLM
jgi:hypothetical protein